VSARNNAEGAKKNHFHRRSQRAQRQFLQCKGQRRGATSSQAALEVHQIKRLEPIAQPDTIEQISSKCLYPRGQDSPKLSLEEILNVFFVLRTRIILVISLADRGIYQR
jgi:hypothetical protein